MPNNKIIKLSTLGERWSDRLYLLESGYNTLSGGEEEDTTTEKYRQRQKTRIAPGRGDTGASCGAMIGADICLPIL